MGNEKEALGWWHLEGEGYIFLFPEKKLYLCRIKRGTPVPKLKTVTTSDMPYGWARLFSLQDMYLSLHSFLLSSSLPDDPKLSFSASAGHPQAYPFVV